MKFTVQSLSDKQRDILQKTNDTEITLTVQYMDFLVSAVKSHGVAELMGREYKSLSGKTVDVVFKAKVSMGYPNTDKAREAVRCLMSGVWKNFVAPCISVDGDDIEYDGDKLDTNHADVKSGKLSIHKEKKGNGGNGGNGGERMTPEQAFMSWFNAMPHEAKDKYRQTARCKAIVKALS